MSTLCGIDLARALPGWGFQIAPAGLPLTPYARGSGKPAVSLSTYTFGGALHASGCMCRGCAVCQPGC